jgi:hypothetical protein
VFGVEPEPPFPPELELDFAAGLVFATEAAWPLGVALLLATCAAGVLPPLGVGVPYVPPLLLGVSAPELLEGGAE